MKPSRSRNAFAATALVCLLAPGCDAPLFPIWPPLIFDEQPAELGPYTWTEFRVEVPNGADGDPTAITVFEPDLEPGAGPAPVMLWVLGSNVQPYYQQSLHETLASSGYVVVISEGRLLTVTDLQYHRRMVDLAKQALKLGLNQELTSVELDPDRIAIGGYSIGGTLATFVASELATDDVMPVEASVIVGWAPSSSPFWTGVRPQQLYPGVTQHVFFILGSLDVIAPPNGFPAELEASLVNASSFERLVVENAIHTQFQQPIALDSEDPLTELSRFDQQAIAITATREFLEAKFGPALP